MWKVEHVTMSYIVKKTLEVLLHRFIFEDRVRISEIIDLLLDDFWKILPPSLIQPIHEWLNEITDEMLWI